MTAAIRDYRPGDEQAANYVCLKTGDRGKDGEPFYKEDPDALGRVYVAPYLKFSPELALILEDNEGVCGYALATLNSRDFFDRYEKEWRPPLCEQFPDPSGDPSTWNRVQQVHHLYHEPDYFCPEPYEEYPSHLHIDFLQRVRGQGMGRKMIDELIARLRSMDSPGVHLGMSNVNDAAYGFYVALGFKELIRHGNAIYMGMKF
ncbi:MAG: GNAT family N-acetyltransferase [Planctomycetaceae bacterium]|jgi:ribosomal protein S18 acetylase RimI-like enzyme